MMCVHVCSAMIIRTELAPAEIVNTLRVDTIRETKGTAYYIYERFAHTNLAVSK